MMNFFLIQFLLAFQAYWDEASKQVYYGNVVTSETTWTRPTRWDEHWNI